MSDSNNPLEKYGFSNPNIAGKIHQQDSENAVERYMAYLENGGKADFDKWEKSELPSIGDEDFFEKFENRKKSHRKILYNDHKVNRLENGGSGFRTLLMQVELLVMIIVGGLVIAPTNFFDDWYFDFLSSILFVSTTFISKKVVIFQWVVFSAFWAFLFNLLVLYVTGGSAEEFTIDNLLAGIVFFTLLSFLRFRRWRVLDKSDLSVFELYFPNFIF